MNSDTVDWKSAIPARVEGIQEDALDDDLVLYHPEDKRAIYLNQTAALVWALCDGERSVDAMRDLLKESYPDAEGIEDDLQAALQSLSENGVIEIKAA